MSFIPSWQPASTTPDWFSTPTGLQFDMPGQGTMAAPGTDTWDKASIALAGLKTLGNLWGAFQAQKLARKQFNFTKDFAETNLANQIESYNTALSDRARSRGAMEGQTAAQTQAYVDQNKLSRSH